MHGNEVQSERKAVIKLTKSQLIENMPVEWRNVSCLTTILKAGMPLPTEDRRLMVAYLSTNDSDFNNLQLITRRLHAARHIFNRKSESRNAIHGLITYISNLRLARGSSLEQQADILYDIKCWLKLMPEAPMNLGARDIPTLLIMAYYHAVAIASEPYLPSACRGFFLHRKPEVIGYIWSELLMREQELLSEEPASAALLAEAIDIAVVPMMYAVRYRFCHGTSLSI